MVYLAPIFLLAISYIYGELVCVVLRDKKTSIAEKCLIGTFFIFISYEILTLISIKTLLSFRVSCIIYSIFLLLMLLLSALFASKRIYNSLTVRNPINFVPCFIVLFILTLQLICFFILIPDTSHDYTVETINTTITSDLIYENHPGMGSSFENGITFRGKIISLPIFYAYISNLFSGNVCSLTYRAIPSWTLSLSYLCYGIWAAYLFKKDTDKYMKIAIFLAGLGILNMCGMFSRNCIFYNQMLRGFRGETICFCMIIPYCIYCLFSMISNGKNNKWIYLFMALISSLTLADYQKGFIPCLFSMLILIVAYYVNRLWRRIVCRS